METSPVNLSKQNAGARSEAQLALLIRLRFALKESTVLSHHVAEPIPNEKPHCSHLGSLVLKCEILARESKSLDDFLENFTRGH